MFFAHDFPLFRLNLISEGNVLEITFYSDATVSHKGRDEHHNSISTITVIISEM